MGLLYETFYKTSLPIGKCHYSIFIVMVILFVNYLIAVLYSCFFLCSSYRRFTKRLHNTNQTPLACG